MKKLLLVSSSVLAFAASVVSPTPVATTSASPMRAPAPVAPTITSVPNTITSVSNCCDNTITSRSNCKSSCYILRLEAEGVGVPPCSGACSTAQAKVMARRAAIVDAYKALAEKMYGLKINGRDTVKNMILQNSILRSYVEGLIRGAQIEDEEFKDGIYRVTLSVKINVKEWNKYLLSR